MPHRDANRQNPLPFAVDFCDRILLSALPANKLPLIAFSPQYSLKTRRFPPILAKL
jgi:hypothetical protein